MYDTDIGEGFVFIPEPDKTKRTIYNNSDLMLLASMGALFALLVSAVFFALGIKRGSAMIIKGIQKKNKGIMDRIQIVSPIQFED